MALCRLGVLISEEQYRKLLSGGLESWRINALRQETTHSTRRYFICPTRIDLDLKQARAAVATPGRWWEGPVCPAPSIYHNLVLSPTRQMAAALRALSGDPRTVVFNETNRWNRRIVGDILSAVPGVRECLLEAVPLTAPGLEALSKKRAPILLAPARGSIRRHGFLLDCTLSGEHRYLNLARGYQGVIASSRSLEAFLGSLSPGLQWAHRLSGWPVGPDPAAEWRLYLMREGGEWTIAAEVAKRDLLRVAGEPRHCWEFERALERTFGRRGAELAKRLRDMALGIMRRLTLFLPGIWHCAVDFWIDGRGRPMLADLTGGYDLSWLHRLGDTTGLERLLTHPARVALELSSAQASHRGERTPKSSEGMEHPLEAESSFETPEGG